MPIRLPERRTVLWPILLAAAVLLFLGSAAWRLGRIPHRPAPVRDVDSDRPVQAESAPSSGDSEALQSFRPRADSDPASQPSVEAEPARPRPLPGIAMAGLQARPDGDGLFIVFDQGLFSRHASLSDDARTLLKQLAVRLRPALTDRRLEITGHTDPSPVRSDRFADNQSLGYARARMVSNYLASEGALPPDALAVFSAGDTRPPYSNATPELRRKNRTVTLRLVPR